MNVVSNGVSPAWASMLVFAAALLTVTLAWLPSARELAARLTMPRVAIAFVGLPVLALEFRPVARSSAGPAESPPLRAPPTFPSRRPDLLPGSPFRQ